MKIVAPLGSGSRAKCFTRAIPSSERIMRPAPFLLTAIAFTTCGPILACSRSPAAPAEAALATGQWSGQNVCLSVSDRGCNLVVGCGHGQFLRPVVRADGTFDVDGTYRIEVGPVSTDPPPPAHFSGLVRGSSLTLHVTPTGSLPPASYSMTLGMPGMCLVLCL